jgi:hypothetical protein
MFVLTKHRIDHHSTIMPHNTFTAWKMSCYTPEAVTNMASIFDDIDGLSLEEKNIAARALLRAYKSYDDLDGRFGKGGLDHMYHNLHRGEMTGDESKKVQKLIESTVVDVLDGVFFFLSPSLYN